MKAEVICKAEHIKTFLRGIGAIAVSEAKLRFTSDGLKVSAVDPANVAMIHATIDRTAMDVYSAPEEELVVGIDVARLYEMAKGFKDKEPVELIVEDSRIKLKNKNLTYSVALIDPNAIRKEPKLPEMDLPMKVVLGIDSFKQAVQAANKISDHVILRCDGDKFYIEAKGYVDAIKTIFDDTELIEFVKAEAKTMFSIEYLLEFCKAGNKLDIIDIRLGTDYPGFFSFRDSAVELLYVLAPRIENV